MNGKYDFDTQADRDAVDAYLAGFDARRKAEQGTRYCRSCEGRAPWFEGAMCATCQDAEDHCAYCGDRFDNGADHAHGNCTRPAVSLVKPFPKGARVIITHRGGQSEWRVIGRESRAGQHTGWVRVEYDGWLSASVREADVELIAEAPEVPIYICRDAKCQREVDGPDDLCLMHLCVVCDYDPRQAHLPICEGCEQHARRTGRDVNAMIAAGYDVLAEYRAQERHMPEPMIGV